MKILITICARGGSKGLPDKNIKKLNGKHLISYSIDLANKFKDIYKETDVVLSSDSEKIIEVSKKYNLFSDYVRPKKFAGDKVGKLDAIKDVLFYFEDKNKTKYDYVLDLDVTSPLRNIKDLLYAFKLIESDKKALSLFSVSHPNRNPYFNVVEKKINGYYNLVKKSDKAFLSRQNSPVVYDINASFYFYRRVFFDKKFKTALTDNSLIYLLNHVCFDIDEKLDFDIMEYLVSSNKLDFDLWEFLVLKFYKLKKNILMNYLI